MYVKFLGAPLHIRQELIETCIVEASIYTRTPIVWTAVEHCMSYIIEKFYFSDNWPWTNIYCF
jgi:hypothetical protein